MRKSELIDIYILEILEKNTTEKKTMSQKELIKHLFDDYGLEVGRNTLSKYLSQLRNNGYIAGQRGVYKVNKFNDHELRLLIDGVLFGQHIPADDASKLIEKLKAMSELGLKDRVKNVYYVEGFNRTQNKRLYQMIDTIDEAIQKEKQLVVAQAKFDIEKGRLVRTGRELTVDPYQLVTEKSHYYLICFVDDGNPNSHHGKGLENLRIDRWWSVDIAKTPRRRIETVPGYEHGFRLDDYMREHIYMWSGKSERVTLRIKSYNISDFIDWFGTDYRLIKYDKEYMEVSIKVNINAIKLWALQYGRVATVLRPESLRKEIAKELQELSERYKNLEEN